MTETNLNTLFGKYSANLELYDEVFDHNTSPRPHYEDIFHQFSRFNIEDFQRLNEYAKISFLNQGITYAVYSEDSKGSEKIFPFDLFPRIIPAQDWELLEKGLIQRNVALNEFIKDIYHQKKILHDKVVPARLIFSSPHYCEEMLGIAPRYGIYCHISGTDLIRHSDGKYYVLEDNLRSPSGVSYVLSNRDATKRTLSNAFKWTNVHPVNDYPLHLLNMLQSVAPPTNGQPTCVLLTPGVFNSAYYEHSFLAQSMGIELVEGRDLFVNDNYLYMRTIYGPKRVDVVYRRIDDAFLDPLAFRSDSILGVPGIMSVYRAGRVTIVNAPGTGVADDKAICSYVPDMIRYYLGEEAILPNVPTYLCEREDELKFVMENLPQLVVKPVDMSGGYGVTICNRLGVEDLELVKRKIQADPRNYIAQPIMSLSVHATYIEEKNGFCPRHIDLRSFMLLGKDMQYVLKGGLSRVALKEGSLIVNSSQGGGSKDTWVIEE